MSQRYDAKVRGQKRERESERETQLRKLRKLNQMETKFSHNATDVCTKTAYSKMNRRMKQNDKTVLDVALRVFIAGMKLQRDNPLVGIVLLASVSLAHNLPRSVWESAKNRSESHCMARILSGRERKSQQSNPNAKTISNYIVGISFNTETFDS